MKSLFKKFESFGCQVISINGHNFKEIDNAFENAITNSQKLLPKIIIASTIKGKGIKSMEGELSSHYETLTKERYEEIIKDID